MNNSLKEAWSRLVNHTYTIEDLVLILDSVKEDEPLQEFYEVDNRVWDEAFANTSPLTEEQKKAYRRKAAQLIAEYERKNGIPSVHIPSRTIVRFRKIWYAAAAAILLGLLIPAVQFFVKPTTEQVAIPYIIKATQRGEIKTIVLPDQTKVTLNVASRLKYPAVFAGERTVELQGGAIFDVTPDSERPFTVATTDMNVSVLGTVFDVKAYPDDESLMVSVASGKVEVTSTVTTGHAPLLHDSLSHTPVLLGKNHQLIIDKATGNIEKYTIDVEKYLSWTDGILYFTRTPIQEVVNMLNRSHPQMVFKLAKGEYPDLITGRLETKKLDTILDTFIQSLGLQYKKTGNIIILYNGNHNK